MSTDWFTCTASTEYDGNYGCEKVYDLNAAGAGPGWATRSQGEGAWIKIQFPQYVQLSRVEIRHRSGNSPGESFKDITLSFSDGTNQSAILQDGTDPEWNVITMTSLVKTHSVKILANSVHASTLNPGFSEIRFSGCPGMSNRLLKCYKKPWSQYI